MPPPFQRHQRVESLIREELDQIFLKELEFPGTLVTVTEVAVQKDLDYANVKISVIPGDKSEAVINILEKRKQHFRRLLLKKINIKPMPEIRFIIDVGLGKAAELEKTFLEIEKEKEID